MGGCFSTNALAVKERLEEAVTEAGSGGRVPVRSVGCMGLCSRGPLVQVDSGTYEQVTPEVASAEGKRGSPRPRPPYPNVRQFSQLVYGLSEGGGRMETLR